MGQSFYNMIDYVADRIADESEIRRGKLFPYKYFAADLNADLEVPQNIRTALHNAAEIACGNVPQLPGTVVIGLDTSGSMSSAVTGHRGRGATSKSRCIDVAAPSCPDTALLNQSIFTGISLIHPTLFSATVMAKCVPENVEVVCPREICYKGFLAMAESEYL